MMKVNILDKSVKIGMYENYESGLCEEEWWNKETVKYMINNAETIKKKIAGLYKATADTILTSSDVDDIYSETVMYMYRNCDYTLNKALDTESGNIVPIEAYIMKIASFYVKRTASKKYDEMQKETNNFIIGESSEKELSIFDSIADKRATSAMSVGEYDIERSCRVAQAYRYKNGFDCLLVVYINMLAYIYDKRKNIKPIMELLGINIDENIRMINDSMQELVACICALGIERCESEVQKYVYGSSMIKDAIMV